MYVYHLQEVSHVGTDSFASGKVTQGLAIGNNLIVPALKELSLRPFIGDEQVIERVREDWCQCLGQNDLTEGVFCMVLVCLQYLHVQLCMYIHVHACIYVYMYVYMYTIYWEVHACFLVNVLIILITVLSLISDDAGKFGDLLVRMVDEYSKISNMELPETPSQFDTQTLVAQFSNSFKFLCTEIIPELDSILNE